MTPDWSRTISDAACRLVRLSEEIRHLGLRMMADDVLHEVEEIRRGLDGLRAALEVRP